MRVQDATSSAMSLQSAWLVCADLTSEAPPGIEGGTRRVRGAGGKGRMRM